MARAALAGYFDVHVVPAEGPGQIVKIGPTTPDSIKRLRHFMAQFDTRIINLLVNEQGWVR